jgi:hypothetical protein
MHDDLLGNDDLEDLIREIEVYLTLVALLRQEGYEPHWALEPAQRAAAASGCEMPVRAL